MSKTATSRRVKKSPAREQRCDVDLIPFDKAEHTDAEETATQRSARWAELNEHASQALQAKNFVGTTDENPVGETVSAVMGDPVSCFGATDENPISESPIASFFGGTTDDTDDTICDLFADTEDTTDRAFQKAAEAAQRKRNGEQLAALRERLKAPIKAGEFSEMARGGHGPSSMINKFFGGGSDDN
jgi:hypothetical protein